MTERSNLYDLYQRYFEEFPQGIQLLARVKTGIPAWHLCVALIDFASFNTNREEVMQQLHAQNIGSQLHYIPLYRQPFFAKKYGKIRLAGRRSLFRPRAFPTAFP